MKLILVFKKILGTALTILLALLLACNLYTIAVRHLTGEQQPDVFGYSAAIVISGSMSGSIEVNDMVVIHEESHYAPGDVITYKRGDGLVTHRIIENTPEGFVTKGDANNTEDLDPVLPKEIVGKVVCVIPKIGAVIEFLQTPLGLGCLMVIGVGMVAAPMLTDGPKEQETKEGNDDGK